MKFVKSKNLIEGEELLYIPTLHWMYTVKQTVVLLLLIPVLLIIRALILSFTPMYYTVSPMYLIQFKLILNNNIIQLILGVVIVAFLILTCRIFLYLSVEFGVTNKRLMMKKGVFRAFTAEIPTDRIESIYCIQGLLGKIFNYGTICISGIGGKTPVFFMVMKPYALRRKIAAIIEKNKTITVIHGDLPRPVVIEKPELEEEPIYRYGTFVRVLPNG